MPIDDQDDFPELRPEVADRLATLDEESAAQRANALRGGLEEYELDEEDRALLDAATDDVDQITYLPALPVLAIVGRPNVGKSALVNRILGRREAVVAGHPRRHPRPGQLQGGVERPPLHHRRHGRMGAGCEGHPRIRRRPGGDRGRPRRRCAVRGRLECRPDGDRRARRADAALVEEAGHPGRQQGRRRPAGAGGGRPYGASASASRGRCRRCTAGEWPTCSTRC